MNKLNLVFVFTAFLMVGLQGCTEKIKVGSCYESSALPGLQVKIQSISDDSVLLSSEISPIPTTYNKKKFLDELSLGTTLQKSCTEQKSALAKTGVSVSDNKQEVQEFLGVDLRNELLSDFKKIYADQIETCKRVEHTEKLVDGSETKGKLILEECKLKEGRNAIFVQTSANKDLVLHEISKNLPAETKLSIVTAGLSKKIGKDVFEIQFHNGMLVSDNCYKGLSFHNGIIRIHLNDNYPREDYDKAIVESISYFSNVDIRSLTLEDDKRIKIEEGKVNRARDTKKSDSLNL